MGNKTRNMQEEWINRIKLINPNTNITTINKKYIKAQPTTISMLLNKITETFAITITSKASEKTFKYLFLNSLSVSSTFLFKKLLMKVSS